MLIESSDTTNSTLKEVGELFLSFLNSVTSQEVSNSEIARGLLELKIGGPLAMVSALVSRLLVLPPELKQHWHPENEPKRYSSHVDSEEHHSSELMAATVKGDEALTLLSYLAHTHPSLYLSPISSVIRQRVQSLCLHVTNSTNDAQTDLTLIVSDALLAALSQLLVAFGENDDYVRVADDASVSLLGLCRCERAQCCQINNESVTESSERYGASLETSIAQRIIGAVVKMWEHFELMEQELTRSQARQKISKAHSSTARLRCATFIIDIALLGNDEFLSVAQPSPQSARQASLTHSGESCMNKILQMAFIDNEDPLLQMSALDQLERLATSPHITKNGSQTLIHSARARYLCTEEFLRDGLLRFIGVPLDQNDNKYDRTEDPINSAAALRLLTEICRVGVTFIRPTQISSRAQLLQLTESQQAKFYTFLALFHKALLSLNLNGEVERLNYIYAVSSLVSSCASVVSSSSIPSLLSVQSETNAGAHQLSSILQDQSLIHAWLHLHSNASQPKLKSAVMCSLAQVMEPTSWKIDVKDNTFERGTESTVSLVSPYNFNHANKPNDDLFMKLFHSFGESNNYRDPTELVLSSAKSPFIEERLGAYALLNSLVMRGVGLRTLLLYGNTSYECYDGGSRGNSGKGRSAFLDWMLQENESIKEGRDAKYCVVKGVVLNEISRRMIEPETLRSLQQWLSEGPHNKHVFTFELASE